MYKFIHSSHVWSEDNYEYNTTTTVLQHVLQPSNCCNITSLSCTDAQHVTTSLQHYDTKITVNSRITTEQVLTAELQHDGDTVTDHNITTTTTTVLQHTSITAKPLEHHSFCVSVQRKYTDYNNRTLWHVLFYTWHKENLHHQNSTAVTTTVLQHNSTSVLQYYDIHITASQHYCCSIISTVLLQYYYKSTTSSVHDITAISDPLWKSAPGE